MSAKIRSRMVWSVPVVVLASWLAVRALVLVASPVAVDNAAPKLAMEAAWDAPRAEIGDPSLRQLIGRFAAAARSGTAAAR